MKKILSIDLNSKNALVGVINQYGEIEDKIMIENDPENLMNNLASKTKEWLKKLNYNYNLDIERIGLSAPGFIDRHNGIVRLANALNWKDYDLKREAEKAFNQKKIYVLNSANANALGEFWIGAATDYNSELFYSLGSRIGGAIVMDGKLILGEHGFAGEFGHGGLTNQTKVCECGLNACLEPMVSINNFEAHFQKILQDNHQHPARKYFSVDQNLNLESIIKIYRKHQRPLEIKEMLKLILRPFVSHISIMISALDPKSIVIGGTSSAYFGNDLLEIIHEELEPLIPDLEKQSLILKTSQLGRNAGIIGAAYFAMNNWYEIG